MFLCAFPCQVMLIAALCSLVCQGAGMKISEPYSNATGTFYEAVWDNITITNPRFAATYLNVYQVRLLTVFFVL